MEKKLGALLLTGVAVTTLFTARTSPAIAQTVLVEEAFDGNTIFGWSSDGVGIQPCLTAGNQFTPATSLPGCGDTADPLGEGVLRLTSDGLQQSAFAFYDYNLPTNHGLVITFDYFTYGGAAAGGPPSPGDGIAFFLIDSEEPDPSPGAFGGSLGYAQRTLPGNVEGLTQAYLGVGLDESGNFANDGEGRGTGCTVTSPFGTSPAEVRVLDSVTVRGSGDGLAGYCYLNNSGNLETLFGEGIDEPAATPATRNVARRKLRIVLSQTGQVTVAIDFTGTGNNFQPVFAQPINLNTAPDQAGLPASLKLGVTSSTGSASNFHEIGNFKARTIANAPTPDLAISGSFSAGGTGQYTLSVSNVGNGPTYGPTTITNTLPPGSSLVSFTGTNWNCSENPPGTVTCVYSPEAADPAIQPGQSQSVILNVNVFPTPGSLTNTAVVSTTADNNLGNNTATISTNLLPPPPICNRAGDVCEFESSSR